MAFALLAAVLGHSAAPKTALVRTPYGHLRLYGIQIIQVEADRPCGFAANVDNLTQVSWDSPVFAVVVSGATANGTRKQFGITATPITLLRRAK